MNKTYCGVFAPSSPQLEAEKIVHDLGSAPGKVN
jgi:hypothetical protein